MELIGELEKETRGVYGGAVGYWGYDTSLDGKVEEGDMDTYVYMKTSDACRKECANVRVEQVHCVAHNAHEKGYCVPSGGRRNRV
jgi:hypothetical protein